MKTKLKIPSGWRKLRTGTKIKDGDMFQLYFTNSVFEWADTSSVGNITGYFNHSRGPFVGKPVVYIRKINQ